MRRAHLLDVIGLLVLAAPRAVSGQMYVEPTGKNFHKVVSLDSMNLRWGTSVSPDNRWLTFSANDAIWIMPADGRAKPTRLLSAGYVAVSYTHLTLPTNREV